MPRLVRLLARMNVGGPARHVLRIAPHLAAAGWESILITGRPAPGEGDLVEEARDAGLQVEVVPEFGRALRPWSDARALSSLRRRLGALRPDLVHTHTAKAGALGRWACPRAAARVHTFHGHVLNGYFPRPVSAAFAAVERFLARRTDALVAVCPPVRDELLAHGVGEPEQYTIIPPGFDPERCLPDRAAGAALRSQLGVASGDVLVGYVGRLAPVKNVPLLLAAFARAGKGARLLLVGDGQQRPDAGSALCLPARTDLSAVWGALDLLVLPSRHEGLPQVIVEAQAAGVPVLATAVGGVPGLLGGGKYGRLVPSEDLPALAAALAELIGAAELRAAYARAAAARSREEHLPSAVAARLAGLYEQILEKRRRAAHPARACISSS